MAKQIQAAKQNKSLLKLIDKYYADLADFARQNVLFEMGTRHAFHRLMADAGKPHGWTLIAEQEKKVGGKTIRPDGTFKDHMSLVRGYWEAKDTADKLDTEIEKKRKAGYPLNNIIFEDTQTAILYQHGQRILSVDMRDAAKLAELITEFFRYVEPEIEEFEQAVAEFKERVPDLAEGLAKKIEQAHRTNNNFKCAFAEFFELCQTSLNPNISQAAVDEMLIQHILTERLIREIFDNPEFVRRNVIAAEVEKVMLAMTSHSFDRNTYLRDLDRFYVAIEHAARTMTDWSDKQYFLNTVYERFFQGYSVKLADTMGIVYTPQEIVDFMCASVAEVLENEFGKKLYSDDVYIIDPCTGTGNFIVNLIRRIPKAKLEDVYKHRLFANEIMLLPYYIAALNIEHAYWEQAGKYEGFEGLCFVDTLDMAEHAQRELSFMTERNSARVQRQKKAPITVVIGNPPYNASQVDETDNNKNREYAMVDARIRDTYIAANSARKTKLYDPYVKFFRWATDRLEGRDGIVCLISNNSFVHKIACDGLQKCMAREFSEIYHLDLRGDVRENPTLSGTAYNVFGIQVGVGITVAVRHGSKRPATIHYHAVSLDLRRAEKLGLVARSATVSNITWQTHKPDAAGTWMRPPDEAIFATFIPVASRESKGTTKGEARAIFASFSLGVSTNRDGIVYAFDDASLMRNVEQFAEAYSSEQDRYRRRGGDKKLDEFLDHTKTKWSRNLKRSLANGATIEADQRRVRNALYRPFSTRALYFADVAVDESGQFPRYFPTRPTESENRLIAVSDRGYRASTFSALIAAQVADLHLCASLDGHQCFPFFVYDEDGSNRRENITDWALAQFREHYKDKKIGKWDIFHYVYGLLHHPGYRQKYADNLKRELPRIPFAPANSPLLRNSKSTRATNNSRAPLAPVLRGEGLGVRGSAGFWAFAKAGEKLAKLHLDYEKLKPWDLDFIEAPGKPLSYRIEDKMRLSKDKLRLTVNPSLTLATIPPETFNYRLGNRSALEWVIDQYQFSTDKRSGITSDPNRDDDPQYIVRLVGQVIRVSLETVKIVNELPPEFEPASSEASA